MSDAKRCSYCYSEGESDRMYWQSEDGSACMCGECALQNAKATLDILNGISENEEGAHENSNKCSFCYTEEKDRVYRHSENGSACMCGNCCIQYARFILEKREGQESTESEESSGDKNEQFQDWLVAIEDKWMEKNVINTFIIDVGGSVNEVHFRFEDDEDGYYLVCELEVDGIDSLPEDVEENILNEIEWAFDEIRDELESEGLDLDAYLGEKLLLTPVSNSNASGKNSTAVNGSGAITENDVFGWMQDGYERECDPISDAIGIAKNGDLPAIFQTLRVYLNYLIEKAGQHEDYVRDACSSLIDKNSPFKNYFITAYKISHDSEMTDDEAKEAINSEYSDFELDDLASYFAYQEVDKDVLFKFVYRFMSCLIGDESGNAPSNAKGNEIQVVENKMKEVFSYLLDAD